MKGVFGLNSHMDLFKKLEWEFAQLTAEPDNAYLAYNFFVTAWHLLDWKYPSVTDTSIRNKIREQTPLLQICEHLAVGSKHFDPRSKHLKAVSDSKRGGVWAEGTWASDAWKEGAWASWLVVSLIPFLNH